MWHTSQIDQKDSNKKISAITHGCFLVFYTLLLIIHAVLSATFLQILMLVATKQEKLVMSLLFPLRFIALSFLLVLVTFHHPAYAENDIDDLRTKLGNEWMLMKNDRLRNIKTYARLEDGKQYRSFKIEAILDSFIEPLTRVLLDFESYTKWYWKTRESRLIKQTSPTEFIVYMVHEAPYGLPDRDVILQGVV